MSLLQCKCAQPLWALGIPNCHPVMRPIARVAFETTLDESKKPSDFDILNSALYEDARRLMTPQLYNVESDRPEAVFEELSGTKFFVRHNPRTFKAIVAKPPAEWGINIEQLRCRSRLGVFLIDAAGVVWGRRVSDYAAAPIPIAPATVQARMLFPSDTTIQKYEITFDFALDFMDFELVPVFADSNLLSYTPPIAARMQAQYDAIGGRLTVLVYALYAQQASQLVIPCTNLTGNIRIRDNTSAVITASFTEAPAGVYTATLTLSPSGSPYTIDINPVPPSTIFDFSTAVATLIV